MISEVKIKVGDRQDEYLVLSLTVLDRLQDMQLNVDVTQKRVRRTRDKLRIYWRETKGGRSYLMLGDEPAHELVDKLMLVRIAEPLGGYQYEWTSQPLA